MTRAIHPVGSMGATIETALAESKPIWWQTPPRLDLAASAVVSAFAEEAKQLMANTASGESPAPLSPEHEAEIRERIDRLNDDRVLTGSTWLASSVGSKSVFPPEQSHVVEDVAETKYSVIRGSVGVFGSKQHAEFTAQAPDDIAALLDEIDRLRAERAETNGKLVELTVALRAAEDGARRNQDEACRLAGLLGERDGELERIRGRASAAGEYYRRAQEAEAENAELKKRVPSDDPARCLEAHTFSPRDGWRMVCANCDHPVQADCHQGGA